MRATNFVRNVRGTVAEKIAESPVFAEVELGGENLGSFLYQTGMSMLDFLFNAMATGNFSGGLGGTGTQAAQRAAGDLSLAIMGSGAAANTTAEAIGRGLSNREAFTLGAIAGVAEMVTEKVSLETLLDRTALDRSAVGYLLKNVLAEGSEEVASDLINWAGDVLVSKDRSQWTQAIQAYEAQGMGEKEAFQMALKDQLISMGMSGLGGGLSGGVMAGGRIAIDSAVESYQNREAKAGPEVIQEEKTASKGEAVKADTSLFDRTVLQNFNMARKRLIEYAREKFPAKVVNVETGKTIGISRTGLDKFLSGNIPFEKYASGFHIPELIERAHKVSDAANYHPSTAESIPTFEYFDSPIEIDGRMYNAHIRVKNTQIGDKYYGHTVSEVEDIKIEHPTRTSVPAQPAVQPENTGYSTSDTIIPQGGEGVKEEFAPEGEGYTEKPKPKQLPETEEAMMTEKRSTGEKGLSTLNDAQVDELLGEGTMVRFLTKRGGLKLTKDMTLSQRREALRQAMAQATGLTAEKGKAGAAQTAGSDSGLVYDDFVKQAVRSGRQVNGKTYITKETYRLLDSLAKALGVRVRFVDSVLRGKANAGINIQEDGSGGYEILIEKNNPNPLRALLGHELTHRIQQLAPEEYRTFRDYVEGEAATADSVAAKVELYRRHGLEISRESALDEVAADYAGKLFESGEALERFIRENVEHRSLLEKVRDFIRSVLDKLTGKEKQQATEAERRLTEALEAAMEQAKHLEGRKNTATEGGEVTQEQKGLYAIKTTPDGKKYVKADRQVIFGNDPASWGEQLEDYINGKIRRGENVQLVAEDGDVLTLTGDTAGKVASPYTSDGKTLSEEEYYRKVNAGVHIDELAQVSRSQGKIKPDAGGRHGEFASGGWDYRDAYFQDFDGKYYQINLSAAIGEDGKVVYNIGAMQERSFPTVTGSSAESGALSGGKTSSGDIIRKGKEKVKGKLSLKGEEKMLRDVRMPTLSDAQVDELLGEGTMVRFLTKRGGLKLTKDMTLSQRREAVRKAVAQIGKGGNFLP